MYMHMLPLSYQQLEWGSKRNLMLKIPLPWETSTVLVFMFSSSAMKINIEITLH